MEQKVRDTVNIPPEWLELIDQFCRIVYNRTGISTEQIMYLVERRLIPSRVIAAYMVRELYPASLSENGSAWAACVDLSLRTGLSEQTIWAMMQNPSSFEALPPCPPGHRK